MQTAHPRGGSEPDPGSDSGVVTTAATTAAGPARIVVDLDAIAGNTRVMRERATGAAVLAVVKADAYGHGLVPSARAALAGGATWLGTAQLAEALTLRSAGVGGRVLTWLHAPGADFAAALIGGIDVGVSAPWALGEVADAARATGVTARVHLKADTGLGRNGALVGPAWSELVEAAARLQAEEVLEVVGVMSHLACADEPDHPVNRAQREAFEEALAAAAAAGLRPQVRHLANSAATLTEPATHYDLVRPGLALYGLSPVPAIADAAHFGLRPAMTVSADIAAVKELPAGQGVSYSHLYTTPSPTRVALVPMGYADGVPRHASNTGPVAVGSGRYTVAGRVCMDQIVLDVGLDADISPGDEAVLFGDPARGAPSAQDWADAADTISYEIVTRMSGRLARVHVGDVASTPPDPSTHDQNTHDPSTHDATRQEASA